MEGPSLASRYVGLSLRVYIYGGGVGGWVGGGGGGLFEILYFSKLQYVECGISVYVCEM